eukprot:scaffold19972_cov128-Isochrysis_galbana.AAC.6
MGSDRRLANRPCGQGRREGVSLGRQGKRGRKCRWCRVTDLRLRIWQPCLCKARLQRLGRGEGATRRLDQSCLRTSIRVGGVAWLTWGRLRMLGGGQGAVARCLGSQRGALPHPLRQRQT